MVRNRHAAIAGCAAAALVCACALAGCTPTSTSGTPSVGGDTIAPTIAEFEVSPTSLDIAGGVVSFSAQVSDAGSGLYSVFFEVTEPSSTKRNISAVDEGDGAHSGTYTAPPNTTQSAAIYQVRVVAYDNADNMARSLETSFGVAGVIAPPDIPTE